MMLMMMLWTVDGKCCRPLLARGRWCATGAADVVGTTCWMSRLPYSEDQREPIVIGESTLALAVLLALVPAR